MKFGIRATRANGKVQYVSSTRYHAALSDKFTDIALFVQEKSAIEAVKALRKDGNEKDGLVFDVIGVEFVVAKETQVPRPPKTSGFIIVGSGKLGQYYHGTKKPGQYSQYSHFGSNIERVTVFQTQSSAEQRLRQLAIEAEIALTTAVEDVPRNSWMTPEERKVHHDQLIEYAKKHLSVVKNAKVEKYES